MIGKIDKELRLKDEDQDEELSTYSIGNKYCGSKLILIQFRQKSFRFESSIPFIQSSLKPYKMYDIQNFKNSFL